MRICAVMASLVILCIIVIALGAAGVAVRDGRCRPILWATSIMVLLAGIAVWSVTGILEDASTSGVAVFLAAASWPSLGCLIGEILHASFRQGSRKAAAT